MSSDPTGEAERAKVSRWKAAIETGKRARAVSPAQVLALPAALVVTLGIIGGVR